METIKQLITDGKTDEAIRLLDEYIEKNTSSDEAYYLRGNAYRKKGVSHLGSAPNISVTILRLPRTEYLLSPT